MWGLRGARAPTAISSLYLALEVILTALVAAAPAAGDPRAVSGPPLRLPPGLEWLNVARALTPEDLKGKVVILDFWTYGCINCIHVAEELRQLEERFGSQLVVIGVHSPKFDHERNLEGLRSMVVRLDRRHPILSDPDWSLMDYYGARAWPTLALFAPDGRWVGQVSGEGQGARLARAIEGLLESYREELDDRPLPIALEKDRLAASRLAAPGKIAISPDASQVAISDTLHHRVIVAGADGKIRRIFGSGTAGLRDGPAAQAQLDAPQGLAFVDDVLLVADPGSHTLRRIDLGSGWVGTLAGSGRIGLSRVQGEARARQQDLRSPWDLVPAGGAVYVAMAGSHQIWRLDLADAVIAPYAGSGREGIDGGGLAEATFSQPSGLALIGADLFVADAEASAIRRVSLEDGRVETLIGRGLFEFGDRDGPFAKAQLQHPAGIAALGPDRLAVADTYNHKVKLIDLKARTVTTVLGTGKPGRRIGKARETELNEPGGLASVGGRLWVADTNNHRILSLRFDPEGADPPEVSEWIPMD